jgi:quinol monooxygenase YgiN
MKKFSFSQVGLAFLSGVLILSSSLFLYAQTPNQVVRLVRIIIDPAQLEPYRSALREEIETAVRVEPGVLSLQAVYDKKDPTAVTVFEIYADENAYAIHLETPHFKKYKTITHDMVKSRELIEVTPIALATKGKP